MSRQANDPHALQVMRAVQMVQAWVDGTVNQEAVQQCFRDTRALSPEARQRLDDLLLGQLKTAYNGLQEARQHLDSAQKLLDQYGAAPLIPAMFLYTEETRHGTLAVVSNGGGRRAVALAKEIDSTDLRRGDDVYLSDDQSVLVLKATAGRAQSGELAAFERYTADGRIVLKSRTDEQTVVDASGTLDDTALRAGDMVRWDRAARLCLEKMEETARNPYLLEQVEDVPLERVGGQRGNLRRLYDALLNSLLHPDRVQRFRLPVANSLLLYGPPGTGKTYMTRAIFSEIQRASGKRVLLAAVKASQWESMWVGQTQANITALFESLRRAAAEGDIAVLFIDEIEAVGRIRGSLGGLHSDKGLSTLLTEMNGLQELCNVSVIGACNRKDLLDAALLSRFGDEIPVHRPDLEAAREIFAIHLEEDLPYDHNDCTAHEVRQEMIERAVSRLYAPNADCDLCILKLRDGKTRTVTVRELVSGRLIRQISHAAKRRALRRELESTGSSLCVDDMDAALTDAKERLAGTLTPYNVHNHLESLAEDEVVLAVEPIRRRVSRPLRFVQVG